MQKKDIKVEIAKEGNRGYVSAKGYGVVTFEVQGMESREDIRMSEYKSLYSRYSEGASIKVGNLWVPMWGEKHNLYPQEVHAIVSDNKLLPSIIGKQIKFLFGKGPRLYIEKIEGEDTAARRVRIPYQDAAIQSWLESWEDKGYPHYWEYLKCLIDDFYNVETCISQYHFNKRRRLGIAEGSIEALSYVGSDEARLGTDKNPVEQRIKASDCDFVVLGDWLRVGSSKFQVLPKFSPAAPLKAPDAIAFNNDKTFTMWVYSYNEWFKGLYDWLKGSNLTPKYLNSFLKNALNAHVHVIIPGTWIMAQKNTLQNICNNNISLPAGVQLQEIYKGVRLIDDTGKPYAFSEAMIEDIIKWELTQITELLSGEGKNQGKLHATTKWGEDGWKFEEFPGKFKEYMEPVIDYDKRADQVILAGKGISSSITNVENDGVISKSGSDVYYNYLIYIASLTLDEYFVTKEINRAIRLNFPHAKKLGVKLGFWIDVPAKMEETTPKDRIQNTATSEPAKKQ